MSIHVDMILPYADFVDSRRKSPSLILMSLDSAKVNLIHAVWGMYGEYLEYTQAETPTNRIEELGDFGFYLQLAEEVLGSVEVVLPPVKDTGWPIVQDKTDNLHATLTEFCDLAKKYVIYANDEKYDRLLPSLSSLKLAFAHVARAHGLTLEQLHLLNKSKLLKRYESGYSDAAAAARADKAEGEE